MSVPLPVGRTVERSVSHRPDSPIAARFLERPGGVVCLTINARLADLPGGLHLVESWYRLHRIIRGRSCGFLLFADVAPVAHHFASHQHDATG